MAVKAADQRKSEASGIRQTLSSLEAQLRDLPRVLRLSSNEDFQWYADTWKKVSAGREAALETAKGVFLNNPCGVDETMKLKQASMVASAYSGALRDFMEGPKNEVARLRKVQDEEIPKLREQLRKIEEASKHD